MMGIRISEDGKHITYGPYRDGDKPEFTADPVGATVSFDVFDYQVRDSKLKHLSYSDVAYYNTPIWEHPDWCVIDSDGKIGDHIENLYFTFPSRQDTPTKPGVEDEVNHPKHYTGRKADLECIMFTELMPSLAANAFKYVWRCDDKGDKTKDLEKALWYLDRASTIDRGELSLDSRIQHLMVGMIDSSDFDSWHKLVLDKIVKGYYVDAYNDIFDIIGKPRYCPANPLAF